jgi:hypothetical protein
MNRRWLAAVAFAGHVFGLWLVGHRLGPAKTPANRWAIAATAVAMTAGAPSTEGEACSSAGSSATSLGADTWPTRCCAATPGFPRRREVRDEGPRREDFLGCGRGSRSTRGRPTIEDFSGGPAASRRPLGPWHDRAV